MSKDLKTKDALCARKGFGEQALLRSLPVLFCALCALNLLCLAKDCRAQDAVASLPLARGVIKLTVAPTIDGAANRRLSRKRFFLIKGSLQENQSLVESINSNAMPSRECYYRSIGASEQLRKWLKDNKCDSVYCREVEDRYVEGDEAVPEFREAFQKGLKEFGSREVARKWLTNNLRKEIRDGYYELKQATLLRLIKEAEEVSKAKVLSVMTDSKGFATFTEIEPATYIITNLIPSETGNTQMLWVCEYVMTPKRLEVEQNVKLSNQDEKNFKLCVVERPSSPCEKTAK